MVRDLIMNILEEKREITLNELVKASKLHYGVLKRIIENLVMEGKVEIERKKNVHKQKKYELIVKLVT